MRNRRPSSPIPWIILGVIALFAIVAHIVTPAKVYPPGPIGQIPMWKSSKADGKMVSWAVNPSGTMWAGAWNSKSKDGKAQSAVWIIDFNGETANNYQFKTGSTIERLSWVDDKTFSVDTKGVEPGRSYVDAVKTASATLVSGLTEMPQQVVSADKHSYSYQLAEGEPRPAFTADQIPGTIEGTWASPAGILVLCRNADDFSRYVWDAKTGTLKQIGKDGYKIDVKANWPEAPRTMMFVTYRGGFSYDLITGKTKELFSYSDLRTADEHWRNEVQDGRLYPRKDGGYTSVSVVADTIDIRILNKEGRPEADLLPRS